VNRFRSTVRRAAAIAGAALVGTVASLALASPASAHHPIVNGSAVCDAATGQWKVTWVVGNSETDLEGKITKVVLTPDGSTVTNIAVDAILPKSGDGNLEGVQMLPGTATGAGLTVEAKWIRPTHIVQTEDSDSITFEGTCTTPQEPRPSAKFASACDGSVTVTLINGDDATAAANFTVTGAGGFTQTQSVIPGGSKSVVVPAANAANIKVTVGDKTIAEGGWEDPKNCAEPVGTVESTCTELIFTIENPADGQSVTVNFTPSVGSPKTLTVAPGETKSVSFPGTDGLTVKTAVEGLGEDGQETVAWEKPADCGSPGLPVTGASIGGAIAAGVALVGVGAGLLLLTRRRRRTTTT